MNTVILSKAKDLRYINNPSRDSLAEFGQASLSATGGSLAELGQAARGMMFGMTMLIVQYCPPQADPPVAENSYTLE